jgi:hypothetical protein
MQAKRETLMKDDHKFLREMVREGDQKAVNELLESYPEDLLAAGLQANNHAVLRRTIKLNDVSLFNLVVSYYKKANLPIPISDPLNARTKGPFRCIRPMEDRPVGFLTTVIDGRPDIKMINALIDAYKNEGSLTKALGYLDNQVYRLYKDGDKYFPGLTSLVRKIYVEAGIASSPPSRNP